jgi:hypothetical protein
MKHILILLAGIVFISASCKKASKTTTYSNNAVIKGPTLFMTACGGAYWIVIDTVNARTTFNSLPAGSGIDLTKAIFPMNVKLNWHYQEPNTCAVIIIDAIEKTD